jgi:hypothetical protein
MKTLKLLVLGATLMTGLVACPRENIIFSTDPRIVRGNWAGTAKRVCANVSQTAWSPDGTKIVSNGKRTVIWDALTGARVRVMAEQSQQVVWTSTAIITASGPSYVAGNQAVVIKFWNPTSGVLERSLNVAGNFVVISPDGTRGVVSVWENGLTSARVVSLTDGSMQHNLSSGNDSGFFVWTSDGKRIVSQVSSSAVMPAHSPPDPLPVQQKIRVWLVATGAIERDIQGSLSPFSISPDGKTLAYSDSTPGLKFLNLETGEVRSLANSQGGVLGWNPSSSKFFLQSLDGSGTEIWNLGTLKLEKSLPGTSGFAWNSFGAPADTGVTSSVQSYDPSQECSLKILDLTTLKTTRTLDETALDPLEVKLFLKATYLTESEYGIGGTASVAGTELKVRGLGNAGTRGRLVAQTPSDMPMSAGLELLDANGVVAWRVPSIGGYDVSPSLYNQTAFNGFITNLATAYSPYDADGYNFKLMPAP